MTTHQTEPQLPALNKAIAASLKSLKEQEGEIDIGRYLPVMLEEIGMRVSGVRLMHKLAHPGHMNWHWPKTFYHSYFPRLVDTGYLDNDTAAQALKDMDILEGNKMSTFFAPMMVEVIAEKL